MEDSKTQAEHYKKLADKFKADVMMLRRKCNAASLLLEAADDAIMAAHNLISLINPEDHEKLQLKSHRGGICLQLGFCIYKDAVRRIEAFRIAVEGRRS